MNIIRKSVNEGLEMYALGLICPPFFFFNTIDQSNMLANFVNMIQHEYRSFFVVV